MSCSSGSRARSRWRCTASVWTRATRCSRSPRSDAAEGVDDPPHGPARRRRRASRCPSTIEPMLARLGQLPARGRAAGRLRSSGTACARSPTRTPGELRLESRNLNDITAQLSGARRGSTARSARTRAILDGEIVAFDEHGRPSFAALQQRMHVGSAAQVKRLAKSSPVTYMIFDLLWLDGHSLMELPYDERRELLAATGAERRGVADARAPDRPRRAMCCEATAEQRLEGIVAKRLDSTYQPGGAHARPGSRSRTSGARSS